MITMIKRSVFILFFISTVLAGQAQREKFDPVRFHTQMQQYISREANFTQQEAKIFCAIHDETVKKGQAIFKQIRQCYKSATSDRKCCREIVQQIDRLDLQRKQLQKAYHEKLLEQLPADKVFLAIKAEARFHRQSLKNAAKKRQ